MVRLMILARGIQRLRLWAVMLLATALLFGEVPAASVTRPILFVTQVPIAPEINDGTVSNVFVSVVSALGNHLPDTAHTGRGGDLWIRYADGSVRNLTRAAGFGASGLQGVNSISVRDPHVHWNGTKAIFSMVVGAPTGPADATVFHWQLYEIINFLNPAATPVITKVPNQPANYNNVMPCYGTDGRIIFACDRARDGSAELYPQLDEYNNVPTNTGLWSLDPANGDLFLMDHSPSGSFHPFVDSFGRVLFTRWDHLVQDRNATDDRLGRANNGTFDYASETTTGYDIAFRPIETFPEPRTYDTAQLLAQGGVQGNAINLFFPWQQNEDGTALEMINHVGRHELLNGFRGSSYTNDPNLVQQFTLTPTTRFNTNFLNSLMQIREDPLAPGSYFGIDAPDFGTHASGQVLKLFGPPNLNGEQMSITYVTPKSTAGPNPAGVYRNPLPLTDGTLVAAYSPGAAPDADTGTAAYPQSNYDYRLMQLTSAGIYFVNGPLLTTGLTNVVSYWKGATLVNQTNRLWELQPVEVAARAVPGKQSAAIAGVETQVFAEEGVVIADLQTWLRTNDLALLISRNVTARDRADREQPFNLRVPGGVQTIGTNTGPVYDIKYIQYLQADQVRGLTYGTTTPVPGRRVLAKPMHDAKATTGNLPNSDNLTGASKLGLDGSQATFVPARRGLTHQTVDANGKPAVRERFWLTYQPGEIRTCAVCHGLNVADQIGRPAPTNAPAALRDLLRYWKSQTGYSRIQTNQLTGGTFAASISGPTTRPTVLDASSDFTTWSPVATNFTSPNGLFWLSDPNPASLPQRFYRTRVP